ncbi:Uncharacterized protein SCF082_LOCUS29213 [Durusdinium trenchii]|uniref:Uncharacterized protein n=1 Tax=Durusdinium trenchii TaxID=1381693 RepID=A0ABP0MQ91_9DINO
MALRHFGSRNEDEEAETDQAKIMLMINHFIFARYRYPHRKVLDGVTPFVAIEYLNYICSKHVSLHRPSLKLIMNYEFQMRKEVMEEVNQGSTLICFAYNNKQEGCQGGCGRVHACRICLDPTRPMHEHPDNKECFTCLLVANVTRDFTKCLQDLASKRGIRILADEFDILRDPQHDLLQDGLRQKILTALQRGPKLDKVNKSNSMVELCMQAITIALQLGIPFILEHPEDLGSTARWGEEIRPASIWQLLPIRNWVELQQVFTGAFYQCEFGAPSPKSTRLLTSIQAVVDDIFPGLPTFSTRSQYQGPLPGHCQCGRVHATLIRKTAEGEFATSAAAAYPPQMDREVNMEVMNMEVVAPQILVQILGAITGKVKGTILVNVMGTAVVEADLVKREAFWEEVTAFVDGMSKKERLTLMAELALGRHSSSPFGGKTDEIRGRLGEKVRELGLEPGRKGGDRDTEIAFRRLKAWSELLDNGDWRLERPGEELRENYLSAQEHMGKVKEHVEKDVKKGCLDVRCCF